MAKRPVRGSRGTRPVWLRLGVLAGIFVFLYASMFISGHTSAKLGLDLQGGTSVTLTPKLVDANGKALTNQKISSGAINQAVDIIRQRVNGLGVSEAEVVRAGNNIEISVPGKGRSDVVDLVGQTAQLAFRIPFSEGNAPTTAATPTPSPTPTPSASAPSASPSAGASPTAASSPSASATASASASASAGTSTGGGGAVSATASPSASAAATASASPSASSSAAATPTPSASASAAVKPCVAAPGAGDTPPACITAQFAIQTCNSTDISTAGASNAPDTDWLVACDRALPIKYILRPASLKGTIVSSADSTLDTGANGVSTGQWIVNVSFTSKGQGQWSDLTQKISTTSGCPASAAPECQLAVVLDGVVQSSPTIQGRIAGSAQISGSFTQQSAGDLANVLKFGALPIAFDKSEAVSVSATLGKQSLHAGLLAGLIGLGLVVIYSFIYYRAMGIVTVFSLLISGVLTYGCVVLLGQVINFTLSLAGIAGFIVAVGITADSFVVFYERLKDEVHEGRTVRTSVERSWVRARRTILSADTVSFLAAAALYWLSIGSVRGFAFTLGLSTLLDLVVVFLFTKPVVTLMVRHPLFSTSRWSGLHAGEPVAATASGATVAGPPVRQRLAKRASSEGDDPPGSPPTTTSERPAASEREGS
ncbi:MAG: secD [Mycobacterium sp.]|nr:secD [Mycobacterium sp.]